MVKSIIVIIVLLIGLSSCLPNVDAHRLAFKSNYEKSFDKSNKDPVKAVISFSDTTMVLTYNFSIPLSKIEFEGYAEYVFDAFQSLYKTTDYDMNKRLGIVFLKVIILDNKKVHIDEYTNSLIIK